MSSTGPGASLAIRESLPIMELGRVMAESGFFADSREAAQAVVRILAGRELGFGPVASMTGVHIIKGRVSLSANLIAAALKRSGIYNYRIIEHSEKACEIAFYEGEVEVGNSRFSLEDARAAGLSGDNWRHYPRNMLFARALSNGAKWYCPDVFGGPIYTPDELGLEVDAETGEIVGGSAAGPAGEAEIGHTGRENPEETAGQAGPPTPASAEEAARGGADSAEDRTPAASQAQRRKLMVLCKGLGITERDERLLVASSALGRQVESFSKLTMADAATLIDVLEKEEPPVGASEAPSSSTKDESEAEAPTGAPSLVALREQVLNTYGTAARAALAHKRSGGKPKPFHELSAAELMALLEATA